MSDIPPDLLSALPGSLMTSDAAGLPLVGPQWGIFGEDNRTIIAVDSVDSVDYARDYHVSNYPVEKGKFQSYNKVKVPFQSRIAFLVSSKRTDFLNAIEAAVASLNFVTVVTPEIQYPSANLTHYSYHRDSQHGRTLIRVEVWCEEVRVLSGAIPSSPQSNNASSAKTNGIEQIGDTEQNLPLATPEAPNASPPTENSVGGGFTAVRGGNSPTTIPPGVPNATGGGASTAVTNIDEYIEPPPLVQ